MDLMLHRGRVALGTALVALIGFSGGLIAGPAMHHGQIRRGAPGFVPPPANHIVKASM